MQFGIMVVHDLTNNINYNAEQIQNLLFWGKIVKIICKKSQQMEKYL